MRTNRRGENMSEEELRDKVARGEIRLIGGGLPVLPLVAEKLVAHVPRDDYKALLLTHLAAVEIEVEAEFFFALPERQYRSDWHVIGTNVLIDYEGGLFSKGKRGHSSVSGILRDIEKSTCAQLHGFILIRVAPNHVKSGQALLWVEKAISLSR